MRIPLSLAVAQWALLLALGLLVVTAYRQLGRVLGQAAVPADLGPPVRSRPGPIVYQPLSTAAAVPARPAPAPDDAPDGGAGLAQLGAIMRDAAERVRVFAPGQGQPALVAFVDPTCPSCEQLVTALSAAHEAGELAGLRTLLLTSDPPGYLQISSAFQATGLELGRPLDHADLEPYHPSGTPLLVAIDADGAVTKAGPAVRPAEVQAFIQSCLHPAPPAAALLPVTT
jgi:hypothetical protein